jgi:hypothetical protein
VQQWYGDTSFSSFGFVFGGTAGASSSHPLHLIPLLQQIRKMMKMKKVEKRRKKKMMSEAFKKPSPTYFGCLMTKGERSH